MEKELEKYRARKQKEYRGGSKRVRKVVSSPEFNKLTNLTRWMGDSSSGNDNFGHNGFYPRLISFLKLLLWIVLWGFFIQVEFGTVYFIVSMFYWVYTSMREGTRKVWEPSAYSVFNENCEAIDGTLNAEQFERELKFGAGAVSSG